MSGSLTILLGVVLYLGRQLLQLILLIESLCLQNFASNFGEIGNSIKELMEEFQRRSHQQGKVESIADMKKFIGECLYSP